MGAGESTTSSVDNLEQGYSKYNVDSLQFVEQVNNVRYGEAKVVQNMENGKKYAIKTFIYSNKNDFKQAVEEAQNKQQQLQIPSMVNIADIKTEVNENFCSNFYKIIIVYEYFDQTLEKLITMNKNQNTPFNEQDIYFLIDCILSSLMCMHYNNFSHCDIRPKTIVVSPDGSYKITDMNYLYNQQPTPYKQTILGAASFHKMYLSPEKLLALKNRDLQKLQEFVDDWQKGDVFSLGLVALEMATLRDVIQDVIDYENYEIKKNTLDELLEIVKTRYSYNLYSLISQMLEFQFGQRQDFYKLAEILTPQSQQDSILSLQSHHLQKNQVREFMLSDSHKNQKIYLHSPKQKLSFAKKDKTKDKAVSHFDEASLRQSTIAVETTDATRADINQMMLNNENSEVFNRYKLRQPYTNRQFGNDEKQQAQVRFEEHCYQNNSMHSKSPRLYRESNNPNTYYKKSINDHLPQEPSFKNMPNTPVERSPFKNIENKENIISYKISKQTNLLSQLQKLDVKVNDILEQSQNIKNQFQSKKIEEARREQDVDEKELYDVIEKKKQTIRNLKLEKDNILSHQNSQKSLYQFQEQPSYVSLNNYGSYSNKYISSPRSQNSSYLNIPESNRSKKEEASPYSSKYLNQRSKSPISSNGNDQPQKYFDSVKSLQNKSAYRTYMDYTQKNPYAHLSKNNQLDTKSSSSRSISRKPTDSSKADESRLQKQDQIAERILKNNYNIQQQYDSKKSRNQSPLQQYQPFKSSNLPSNNTSYIGKNANHDNSTLSNQQNNKSNITLYELYLKDYENMIKKSIDQSNHEVYQ